MVPWYFVVHIPVAEKVYSKKSKYKQLTVQIYFL